jgi:hypothetical protein
MSNKQNQAGGSDDADEFLVDATASTMSSMNPDERAELAALLGLTTAELNEIIENWKADKLQ